MNFSALPSKFDNSVVSLRAGKSIGSMALLLEGTVYQQALGLLVLIRHPPFKHRSGAPQGRRLPLKSNETVRLRTKLNHLLVGEQAVTINNVILALVGHRLATSVLFYCAAPLNVFYTGGHWAAATSQMITAYLACLIFGGVLTLASFITGSDTDADAGVPHGLDAHSHEATHVHAGLLPFLSVRFWMFAVTFFGLIGTGLTLLAAGGVGPIAALATSFGVGAGYSASRVLQSLSRAPVGLLGDSASHVGREAKLLLPLSRQQRGKVRLNIGGISTDLVAETESEEALPVGSNVLVVAIRGTVALVEPVPGNSTSVPKKEPSA